MDVHIVNISALKTSGVIHPRFASVIICVACFYIVQLFSSWVCKLVFIWRFPFTSPTSDYYLHSFQDFPLPFQPTKISWFWDMLFKWLEIKHLWCTTRQIGCVHLHSVLSAAYSSIFVGLRVHEYIGHTLFNDVCIFVSCRRLILTFIYRHCSKSAWLVVLTSRSYKFSFQLWCFRTWLCEELWREGVAYDASDTLWSLFTEPWARPH